MKISDFIVKNMGNRPISEYAKTLGISDTQLKRIIHGFWDKPTVAKIVNFCKVFNFDPAELTIFDLKEELIEECKIRLSSPSSETCKTCVNNLYRYTNGLAGIFMGYKPPILINNDIKASLFKNSVPLNIYPDFVSYGKTKEDFISYFYIPYKIFITDENTDIKAKVEQEFPRVQKILLTILTSEPFDKTIIVTSSKRVYLLLEEWFNKYTNIKTNKKLVLAHASIEKAYEPNPSLIIINK